MKIECAFFSNLCHSLSFDLVVCSSLELFVKVFHFSLCDFMVLHSMAFYGFSWPSKWTGSNLSEYLTYAPLISAMREELNSALGSA